MPRPGNAQDRKSLFGDLRVKGGLSPEEISYVVSSGHRPQPNEQADCPRGNNVRCAIADIRKARERFHPLIGGFSWIARSDKEMWDWITEELSRANRMGPL